MAVLLDMPLILCLLYVFVGGLIVGSFLNVLIARLPYEKSIIWPGSRCFHCLQPIRLRDNLPIVGYLRLRGRCRMCGARFSARYLWVELGTAVALTGLFVLEVLLNWQHIPGLNDALPTVRARMLPPFPAIGFFLFHGCLLSLLIAAAIIDAGHRIIPPQISYTGTIIGLIGATLFAWPWPSGTTALAGIPADMPWYLPEAAEHVPIGATLWPFAGPPPDWTPAGSWQLGLLNGLIGAAVGMAIVRLFKFLFEFGFGQEALGLGDADLLMMTGAFLGWQVAVLGFFIGAFAAILMKIPELIWQAMRGNEGQSELPFGPGLAVGIVLTWLGWPLLTEWTRLLFDPLVIGLSGGIICIGLLVAGLLLRRPAE